MSLFYFDIILTSSLYLFMLRSYSFSSLAAHLFCMCPVACVLYRIVLFVIIIYRDSSSFPFYAPFVFVEVVHFCGSRLALPFSMFHHKHVCLQLVVLKWHDISRPLALFFMYTPVVWHGFQGSGPTVRRKPRGTNIWGVPQNIQHNWIICWKPHIIIYTSLFQEDWVN